MTFHPDDWPDGDGGPWADTADGGNYAAMTEPPAL